MTQLPSDVQVAKDYADRYYRQLSNVEEKLRELAIDKKSFDDLLREALTLHRLAISTERMWQEAIQTEMDEARAKAEKKPFWAWRPAR